MKKKCMVVGMVVGCFMMVAGTAWAASVQQPPGGYDGTIPSGGLVWLKNANCFGKQNWDQAMNSVKSLKSGACGLSDGSTAGQWRIPTKDELVNRQKHMFGFINGQGGKTSEYLSSSSNSTATYNAGGPTDDVISVNMRNGDVSDQDRKTTSSFVWPVRGRQ